MCAISAPLLPSESQNQQKYRPPFWWPASNWLAGASPIKLYNKFKLFQKFYIIVKLSWWSMYNFLISIFLFSFFFSYALRARYLWKTVVCLQSWLHWLQVDLLSWIWCLLISIGYTLVDYYQQRSVQGCMFLVFPQQPGHQHVTLRKNSLFLNLYN